MTDFVDLGTGPTEAQRDTMCDQYCSDPEPLHTAQLSNFDWVYFRPWGVMKVQSGYHLLVMCQLYCWLNGYDDYFDLSRARGTSLNNAMSDFADAFLLEVPGAMFLSSMSLDTVRAGRREHLNRQELTCLTKNRLFVRYIEDR